MRPHETNTCFVQTCYRGAFSPDSLWLSGWSGLESLGVVQGATATPSAPTLIISRSGSSVEIRWATQAGFTYELQAASPINAPESDEIR